MTPSVAAPGDTNASDVTGNSFLEVESCNNRREATKPIVVQKMNLI